MWFLEFNDEFDKKNKKIPKKHRQEYQNCFENLQSYLDLLNDGLIPQQIKQGYVHVEPMGIKALAPHGPGSGSKVPLRLYIYPDIDTEILHAILLGDKSTQSGDIEYCKQYVKGLS